MDMNSTKTMQQKGDSAYGNRYSMKGNAAASDNAGMPRETMRGGVAMGKKDMCGANAQFNTGKTAGICYTRTRDSYE